jgi:hypothetical protein
MQADIVSRFRAALPQVRAWIDQLIETNAASARQIETQWYPRLASSYPAELFERARIVTVDWTPFPPVSQFGLPEFAAYERRQFGGITFKNTFFVARGSESESLYFHELVHVVQWSRLGVDRFLLAYAAGLLQFGYEQSPLEKMAYMLQAQFERGPVPNGLMRVIEQGTDAIWSQVEPIVGGQA